jgi:hypothetical protein
MREYTCLTPRDADSTPSRQRILQRFMDLRLRYVTGMGWLTDVRSDFDRYDELDDTLYFVRLGAGSDPIERRPIRAGLRMTPAASVYDSLTWAMLSASPERQADIIAANFRLVSDLNARAASPDHGLWDITRLVAPLDGSIPTAEIIQSIHELLGMAMFKTVAETGRDPLWLFLTTSSIKRLIEMSGIECVTLHSGRISPGDTDDSHLCVARPKTVYDDMGASRRRAHRRAFDNVAAGYHALREQQLPASVR